MFNLLNRIAWTISLGMGFIITFLCGIVTDELDDRYAFDDDTFFAWLIFSYIFGAIFKKLFLSKKFISENAISAIVDAEEIKNIEKETTKEPKVTKESFQTQSIAKNDTISEKRELINSFEEENSPQKTQEKKLNETEKKDPNFIQKFFAENLIAKIAGIIFFISVAFLLNLVYSTLGPVGKILIGFAIGFILYFVGIILDKKGLIGESRILLGLAILVNFAVILAGRYLLADQFNNALLTTTASFVFLILNTILAVVTAIIYNSRKLLFFGFVFAFLNPFLVGGSSSTPYMILGYSFIVSIGALILTSFDRLKDSAKYLTYTAFLGGNTLILLAPFSQSIHFSIKIAALVILCLLCIYTVSKNIYLNAPKCKSKLLATLLVGSYIFFAFLLAIGNNILDTTLIFVTYMLGLGILLLSSVWTILAVGATIIFPIIFLPILILAVLLCAGSLLFIPYVLAIVLIGYILIFGSIGAIISSVMKYFLFGILGGFILLTNYQLGFQNIQLDITSQVISFSSIIIFLSACYYISKKYNNNALYTIGTIASVLNLLSLVNYSGNKTEIIFSTITISIFAILNIFAPFWNKHLTKEGIGHMMIGLALGGLYLIYSIYEYGSIYFPGVTLGIAFILLGLVYFASGFLLFNTFSQQKEQKQEITISKDSIYSYLGMSLGLLTLAIAFLFSKQPEIIAGAWIIESSLLIYFYTLTKETKIFAVANILLTIGVIKLFILLDVVSRGDYIVLASIAIIFGALATAIKLLKQYTDSANRVFYDIFHILGAIAIGIILLRIIPSTGHGWSLVGVSGFLVILSILYALYGSTLLKWFFVAGIALVGIEHIGSSDMVYYNVEVDKLQHLHSLQYIASILLVLTGWIWNKYSNSLQAVVKTIIGIYLFLITTFYIYQIFDSTYVITLYWGILAFGFLYIGMLKNIISFRTLGLYILFLTVGKIIINVFGSDFDNSVLRVIVLMIVSILMFIISSLYTKKYGGNLKGEFNISNLYGGDVQEKIKTKSERKNEKHDVNTAIQNIDISGITQIKFNVANGKNFTTKAKNLLKIVKYVTDNAGKLEFEAGELSDTYKYLTTHYKSQLTGRDLETIKKALKSFVDHGGEIQIK